MIKSHMLLRASLAYCLVAGFGLVSLGTQAQTLSEELTVPDEKTVGYDIPAGGRALKLTLKPGSGKKIVSSQIQSQDDGDAVAWQADSNNASGTNHVYNIAPVFSSRHWVHIQGTYSTTGSGTGSGSLPRFDAYAPAVDIDIQTFSVSFPDHPEKNEDVSAGVIAPGGSLVTLKLAQKFEVKNVKLEATTGGSRIKLYRNADKTGLLSLPYNLQQNEKDLTLYAEYSVPAPTDTQALEKVTLKMSGDTDVGTTTDTVTLLPVEILDKDKKRVAELKVAKMAETGVLSGSGSSATLDISKDSDRFYIRIPSAASIGTASVTVATVENPDSNYNDAATEIDFQVEGSDLITKSLLLVADDVDDGHQVDNIADNAKNDRTFKVQLGGKFKVESVKIGSGANGLSHQLNLKMPVPVKKTVDVRGVILRDKAQSAGGVPIVSVASVNGFWKIAQERYAQVGVKVNVVSVEVKDPPSGVDLTDGMLTLSTSSDGRPLAQEARSLITALGTKGDSSDIHVFYVNRIQTGTGFSGGWATAEYWHLNTDPDYTYNIFIEYNNSMASSAGITWQGYAAAHELGHLLTNAGHEDSSGSYPVWHLMHGSGLSTNGIMGSRRLKISNQAAIHGNSHAY